jgi:thioredoxin 1
MLGVRKMELVINEQNFEQEVVNSDIPVLLDFWAPWCGPCKMLLPVIDEISKEYDGKIKVGKVNTDENMTLSSKFQITSIPCLIIFKGGKAINKMVGFRPKNDIMKEIDNVI